MSPIICAPFYKGLVDAPDRESMALITAQDPTTHNPIAHDRYVALIKEAQGRHPELVQDIARAYAAAIEARAFQRNGDSPFLVSVEGCEQTVGGEQMTGGRIIEHIWDSMPIEIISGVPQHIEHISHCTIEEARTITQKFPGMHIAAVTHGYHVARVETMLQEEVQPDVRIQVRTPMEIMNKYEDSSDEMDAFAYDVVKAGEPTDAIVARERKMEWIYGPLHMVSRLGEKMSGWNLEMYLAERARTNRQNRSKGA